MEEPTDGELSSIDVLVAMLKVIAVGRSRRKLIKGDGNDGVYTEVHARRKEELERGRALTTKRGVKGEACPLSGQVW